MARTLIAGLGSAHGDDAVGWQIVERLRAVQLEGAEYVLLRQPLDLLDRLEGVEVLHVCDACEMSGGAGRLHRWCWPAFAERQPAACFSGHAVRLSDAVVVADRIGILPPSVVIWGVEIGRPVPGELPNVQIDAAVATILKELSAAESND